MKDNRDFKGVWIPKDIWLNTDMSLIERVLYTEISSLDNENHCIASNEYFAKFCGVSERTIIRAIKRLKELGLIKEVEFDGRTRRLEVTKDGQNDSSAMTKCHSINIYNNLDIENSTTKVVELGSSRTDVLESSRTKESSVKQPKKNKFQRCAEFIDTYTDNSILRDLLYKHFNLHPDVYANAFISKVKKLDTLATSDDMKIAIVKQSVDNGWVNFYEVKQQSNRYTNVMSENSSMKCERATDFNGSEEVY